MSKPDDDGDDDMPEESIHDSKGNRINEAYIEEALADLDEVEPILGGRRTTHSSDRIARSNEINVIKSTPGVVPPRRGAIP